MDTQRHKTNVFIPQQYTYTILGDPIALARARYTSNRIYDSQKQIKLVIGIQLANQHENKPLFSGPIHLDVVFHLPLPKKHPTNLPGSYHYYRPDISNLLKFIEDVATGIIYSDDCIISEVFTRKIYGHSPRTEFTITKLPGRP